MNVAQSIAIGAVYVVLTAHLINANAEAMAGDPRLLQERT